MQTVTDGAYKTFTADVPGDLAGKEFHLVELKSNGKIQLLNSGVPVGVLYQRLEGGEDWSVRLLGKGGSVKVIQNGAVTPGSRVKPIAGGKVEALGNFGRSIGVKLQPAGNGAQNDVIEIYDVVEPLVAPQSIAAATSTDGAAADASDSLPDLAAETEKIGDDLRAMRAALIAAGILHEAE